MKISSGSNRDKVRETPKQNKLHNGAHFMKRLSSCRSNKAIKNLYILRGY